MIKKARAILTLALTIAILVALPGLLSASATMDTRTLATVNKPGVVMMYTEWTAYVTWYEIDLMNSFYEDLEYAAWWYINEGIFTADMYYPLMIYLMSENMIDYAFYTGNRYTEYMSAGALGTGFIITPDGYLVTNAHVVYGDEDELKQGFARQGLVREAIDFADKFEAEMRREGYYMDEDEWLSIANAYYDLMTYSMEIDSLSTAYYCFMGNVQPGSDISAKGVRLDLRKIGIPESSKDVAILKLDGSNFPTVPLGDDNDLRTGDQVYAMGYPYAATMSGVVEAPQAAQEPTLTQGIVSAKKQWYDGGAIIQHDAAIHGGNSGGPLFNAKGEVVGINTFGLIDDSGAGIAGFYFSVPISTVKTYLHELNITPTESKFTSDFKTALSCYNSGDYATALDLLRGINETNPGYPVVQELLADSRAAYDANPPSSTPPPETPSESTSQAPPVSDTPSVSASESPITIPPIGSGTANDDSGGLSTTMLIIIIAGAVVVIALVVVIIVISSKKKKGGSAQQSAQGGYQQQTQQQYGAQQGGYQQTQQQYGAQQGGYQQQDQQPQQQQFGAQQGGYQQQQPQQYAPPQQSQAFCDQCGAAMTPGSKFCPACGARKD
ncbi:MAG: trypsin-like peptidase domain-containing protein [Oscillospiraceae bacterium]|nr:trypsin-like peptidase domain-containing protein [Oscillospiraceae bacterium]